MIRQIIAGRVIAGLKIAGFGIAVLEIAGLIFCLWPGPVNAGVGPDAVPAGLIYSDSRLFRFEPGTAPVSLAMPGQDRIRSELSIHFRVRPGSPGTLVSDWEPGRQRFLVGIDSNFRLVFAVSGTGTRAGVCFVRSRSRVDPETWTDCTVVADGDTLKIYLNGFLDVSALVFYDGRIFSPAPGQGMPQGGAQGESREPSRGSGPVLGDTPWLGRFQGRMTALRIYSTPLDQKAVLALAGREAALERLGPVAEILYFSFASPFYHQLRRDHLEQIAESGFSGVCVRLAGAYDARPRAYDEYANTVDLIREQGLTKVWPVVFFNRMFGSPTVRPCSRTMQDRSVFSREARQVKGMDLFDDAGALTALKDRFALALSLARDTGSPGIFIDPEAYHCYDAYDITDLASRHRLAAPDVVRRLRDIGGELADITHRIYPGARLFFYVADLGVPHRNGFQKSITYLTEGMLMRAKANQYPLRVVDGWTGQYVYGSLARARHIIGNKLAVKAEYLTRYPNLEPAGVVAPFASVDGLPANSWIRRDTDELGCRSDGCLHTIEDFSPLYDHLFSLFRSVWIYGATQAGPHPGYDMFSSDLPPGYARVLDEAINRFTSIQTAEETP